LRKTQEERLRRMWRSSRDSARTPVQWSDEENAGFAAPDATPWISVNPNYKDINVEKQEADPDSLLNFYRKAIALRKSLSAVRHGTYKEYRKLSGRHCVYSMDDGKQKLLVVCSFSEKETAFRAPKGFDVSTGKLVLCNYKVGERGVLRPYEARVYLWE